jgi:hypothetical protein
MTPCGLGRCEKLGDISPASDLRTPAWGNSAVALLFKRPDELIASPGCPEGRAEVSFFQKAGDVYCGVGYYK